MRRILPLLLLLAPAALAAQLPSGSVRSLGMAGTYTTLARGYEAPAWNPAVLASRAAVSFSIGLPQAQLEFGSNSYGLSDFLKYQGTTLSPQDKVDLLAKIDTSLDLRTIIGVAPIGLSIWRFAFTLGTTGDLTAGLGKDAVDLALNGNASRAGPGQYFTAAGSHANGWAATTFAGSFAWPFETPLGRLSVGVTYKKVWGNSLGQGTELNGVSRFQVNPQFNATAAGQILYTDFSGGQCKVSGPTDLFGGGCAPGSGSGVDLGGLLEMGHLTLGVTLVNLAGSMTWDASRLRYERTSYAVTQSGSGSVNNSKQDSVLVGSAINTDPTAATFRDSVMAHAGFSRLVRAGATLHAGRLLLSADGQLRLSQGLDNAPKQAVSAGAEYVLLGVLPLRAGIGTDFSHTVTLSAGTGLYLGPFHLDLGAANISGGTNPGVRVGVGLGLMFGGGYHSAPVVVEP